jgi:hypothetical protein
VLQVDGSKITEEKVLEWANNMVDKAGHAERLSSIKDASVSDGQFLLRLLDAVEPGIVHQKLVKPGTTGELIKAEFIGFTAII